MQVVRFGARVVHLLTEPDAVAALTRRIKDGFDPKGVLNPGRMVAGV